MEKQERVTPYKKVGSIRKLKKWWKGYLRVEKGIPGRGKGIIVGYEDLCEVIAVRSWLNKLGSDNGYRRERVVADLKKRMTEYGKTL